MSGYLLNWENENKLIPIVTHRVFDSDEKRLPAPGSEGEKKLWYTQKNFHQTENKV